MCLAIPGRILSIAGDGLSRTAQVDFGGVTRAASLACLDDARVGEYVVVHAGVAISRMDENEAREVFAYLKRIEELGAQG